MSGDTIFALSSGAGRAAVAVIRISGPAARFGLETLAGALPEPRVATLRTLKHGARVLDRALVLWLPGPGSFTGEDVVELHCHGGRAVVAAVTGALADLGLRAAVAGEFTRRALANGKVSLPDVEGLADLLAAETAAQHRQAMAHADGLLTRAAERWRQSLVQTMAMVEAQLDFADEGDVVSHAALEPVAAAIRSITGDLDRAVASGASGERLRDGLTVVLTGPVNVGKSSLLNALAGRDVAIVTDVPGTTRDTLEVHLDLEGVPVTVVDTAGLRETDDPVESEGIRRAVARAARADLVLRLHEAGTSLTEPAKPGEWSILTKIDSHPDRSDVPNSMAVSARSGAGMDQLLSALARWAREVTGVEPALATRERHLACLRQAISHLERACAGLSTDRLELVAEDLRLAVRALDSLMGRVNVEHVLDTVFSSFCIGK